MLVKPTVHPSAMRCLLSLAMDLFQAQGLRRTVLSWNLVMERRQIRLALRRLLLRLIWMGRVKVCFTFALEPPFRVWFLTYTPEVSFRQLVPLLHLIHLLHKFRWIYILLHFRIKTRRWMKERKIGSCPVGWQCYHSICCSKVMDALTLALLRICFL